MHVVGAFVEPTIARLFEITTLRSIPNLTFSPAYDLDTFVATVVAERPDVVVIAGPWLGNVALARDALAAVGARLPPTVTFSVTAEQRIAADALGVDVNICTVDKSTDQMAIEFKRAVLGLTSRDSPSIIRVVIAMKNPLIGQGLAGLSMPHPDIDVRAVCTTTESLWEALAQQCPQLAIIGDTWLDRVAELRVRLAAAGLPEPVWCLAAAYTAPDVAIRAHQMGIAQLSLHGLFDDVDAFVQRMRDVTTSGCDVKSPTERHLLAIAADGIDLDILSMLSTGATNEEIARSVYLSLQTVKNRISRMLKAAGLSNRTELAVRLARGDVDVPRLAS